MASHRFTSNWAWWCCYCKPGRQRQRLLARMHNTMPAFGEPVAVPASTPPVLELLDMYAVSVEAKKGGPLMKALAAVPLRDPLHLKRVRQQPGPPTLLHILLCRADWRSRASSAGAAAAAAAVSAAAALSEAGVSDAAATAAPHDDATQLLPPAVAHILAQHSLQAHTVQVPLHAPHDREQLRELRQQMRAEKKVRAPSCCG